MGLTHDPASCLAAIIAAMKIRIDNGHTDVILKYCTKKKLNAMAPRLGDIVESIVGEIPGQEQPTPPGKAQPKTLRARSRSKSPQPKFGIARLHTIPLKGLTAMNPKAKSVAVAAKQPSGPRPPEKAVLECTLSGP